MADPPKSLWDIQHQLDPEKSWVTHYDDMPALRTEADIIYACGLRGLDPRTADEMYLWEIASYLGLHRIETVAEHDTREIVEAKREYWEQTHEARGEKLAGYSERRKARRLERQQAKRNV